MSVQIAMRLLINAVKSEKCLRKCISLVQKLSKNNQLSSDIEEKGQELCRGPFPLEAEYSKSLLH